MTITRLFAPVAVAAVVTGGLATSASAATSSNDPTLLRQRAENAISIRLTSLQTAETDVNANRWITPTDKNTLLGTLEHDTSGLQQLAPQVQQDQLPQLRTDYQSIFLNFRVYALALPQVRFAAAADDLTGGVLPHLVDADQRLQNLLAGPDSSKDSPAVKAAMADLAGQIQAITTATNGLSAKVLGYTPAQYDADHSILQPARQALMTARIDAQSARRDIATVLGALR